MYIDRGYPTTYIYQPKVCCRGLKKQNEKFSGKILSVEFKPRFFDSVEEIISHNPIIKPNHYKQLRD